ncbi:MAG: hypothetical protein Q7S31_01810 [bacterium]|nr:hypothetical protein [bacterium]
MDKIRANFATKLQLLEKSLLAARTAQQNAPSAMESHSDTTRSEMEKMVTALEVEIVKLKKNVDQIPFVVSSSPKANVWSYVKLNTGQAEMELVLVPEGMGGDKLDQLRLISVATPMGEVLLDKQIGEKIEFNGQSIEVLALN